MTKANFLVLLVLGTQVVYSLAQAQEPFKLIHVQNLSQMMHKKDANLAIFDANTDDTRKSVGVISGAKLLTSSSKYDVATTLPAQKDTMLVFYCANKQCMASHAAAQRAVNAGYSNVTVMADGIQGWVKAGQPVDKPKI